MANLLIKLLQQHKTAITETLLETPAGSRVHGDSEEERRTTLLASIDGMIGMLQQRSPMLEQTLTELYEGQLNAGIEASELIALLDAQRQSIYAIVAQTYPASSEALEIIADLEQLAHQSTRVIAACTQRQASRMALLEGEGHYRQLFETNPAIQLLLEPTTGKIVDANPAACAFYGYSREKLLESHALDINNLPPEKVAQEMAQAQAEQRNYLTFRHRQVNGELRDVEIYASPLQLQGKPLLHAIVHDITERKQAEEAIQALRSVVQELSTPTIPIYSGVLALPLVGRIDSSRAQNITETLLEEIARRQADLVILDITGVSIIDTAVANHLLQTARAANLLGSQVVLVGISAEIAETIVQLGVDLGGLVTLSNLQSGIEYALDRLGMAILPKE